MRAIKICRRNINLPLTQMSIPLKRNYGLKECDAFFLEHRRNTVCKGYTYNNFVADPPLHIDFVKTFLDRNGDTPETRRRCHCLYFGHVSNFRPIEAIKVLQICKSRSVLDPCAGWGGRCFAAMHLGLNYYGFDTNADLRLPYAQMIAQYSKPSTTTLTVADSASADFSQIVYDTVFTSPPYFKREEYMHMPDYANKKDWLARFLKPMMENAYKYLQPGGNLCINLPKTMYKDISTIMKRDADSTIPYVKLKRSESDTYNEYIYVWNKSAADADEPNSV